MVLMQEAIALRFKEEIPHSAAGPQEVLESLLSCRLRADRIEGIYLRVLNIRGSLFRRNEVSKAEADDQWAAAIVKLKNSSVQRGDSFSGPRERYAEADLETLSFKREARKAAELLDLAEEALNIIRTVLKGINDTRQDHISWIRSLNFQSNLET